MRKIVLAIAAVGVAAAIPATAQPDKKSGHKQIGVEASIPFASNNGLQNWTAGPFGSDILYVQDRRQLWYKVELSGSCAQDAMATIVYKTDPTGSFDNFSSVWSARDPNMRCSVMRISTALPPKGQKGYVAPEAGAEGVPAAATAPTN